ncbi:type III-B CRISPR module-associated Cmr3 family protein [Maridesulfovibrio sp.]|uniref:type III-B CRISPR module-associated Cmr3 family protein n=1 Tax=unclassified Maridesulfovibrio TaxID=2794999 RepID=UPI003AFF835A
MNNYTISSDDLIILRDGRPFGEAGIFGGTSLDWPYPQTIAGMVRSAVGFNSDPDFFKNKANIPKILSVGISKITPLLDSGHDEYLLPIPADLCFTGQEERQVHVLSCHPLLEGEGTDIRCAHWLYPSLGTAEKPEPKPAFIRQQFAQQYLDGSLSICTEVHDIDADFVSGPVQETRLHSAIDEYTHSVETGKLFAESGLYLTAPRSSGAAVQTDDRLYAAQNEHGVLGDIKIGFELSGLEEGMSMPESAYLGGERRRVAVEMCESALYPEVPVMDGNERFLKLLLTTHGDFGSWAPYWLVPDGDESKCNWVSEPRSGVRIRLRSAVLSGWAPISGWDYVKFCPKPFRKLVCPGSVYLVELEDPSESQKFVDSLWGASICGPDSQSELDGYGQVVIGKGMHIFEDKE